jgi:hypothetical protein
MKLLTIQIAALILLSCGGADSSTVKTHTQASESKSRGASRTAEVPIEKDAPPILEVSETEKDLASSPDKFALIIANSDYGNETGWADLSSHNDIILLKEALRIKGFKEENIQIVEDADDQTIASAFANFSDWITEGSAVIVHYSGHGQQIFDDNGDEIDGFDEAIVPVNAHVKFEQGIYEGQHHVRDESIGNYLNEIRKKVGPDGQVLAVIDACHSGTGTRGNSRHRGSSQALAPENYKPGSQKDASYGIQSNSDGLAPLVCLYGASPDELNYEYEASPGFHVGSLSFAFSKSFAEADSKTTYRALFDEIKVTMSSIAPAQTPMSEGLSDQVLLGGDILDPVEYYSVTESRKTDEKMFATINGGSLSGLHPGSKIAFYPVGTYDTEGIDPITTGTILDSDALSAQVELDDILSRKDINGRWAMITARNYGDLKVKVQLNLKDDALNKAIADKVSGLSLIQISEDSPELILEKPASRGDELWIYSQNNDVVWIGKNYGNDVDEISDEIIGAVMKHAQIRFLRKLEMEDYNLRTSFEVQPITVKEKPDGSVEVLSVQEVASKIDASGNLVLNDGDWIRIKIKNEGNKKVYFTLMDIMPDNSLAVLLPYEGMDAADFVLEPGKEMVSPPMSIGPPYGRDVFKLIATEEPIDLGRIIQTKGNAATRGSSSDQTNPFEMLLMDSYKTNAEAKTRGARTVSVPAGSAHIESLVYLIK